MKKRDTTNSDLEQLFGAIAGQAPLISEDQVRTLLIQLPAAKPKSLVKDFISQHLNILMVAITATFISVTIILFWINFENKNEEIISGNNSTLISDTLVTDSVKGSKQTADETEEAEDTSIMKSELKPVMPVAATDSVSLTDIFKYLDKKPQIFTIKPDKDTTLVCSEGTSVEIKAGSFVSEKTGKEVTGEIRISVKEYYKLPDVVLAGLSTTSGDKLLETGGMLHVTATSAKDNCVIKPGHDIRVGFPYVDKKENMALFNGERTGNRIDWKVANKPDNDEQLIVVDVMARLPEPEQQVFFIVEEMPEFPGGDEALRKYIEQNTLIPYSALKDSISGKVYVRFVIDETGGTKNIQVVRSLDKTLDKAAVYVVSKLPKWKPGRQRGKPVKVSYTVPVTFSPKQGVLTSEEISRAKGLDGELKNMKFDVGSGSFYRNSNEFDELEENVSKGKLDNVSTSEVNRYIFSVTRLGWLNCDRFYKEGKPLTNFYVLTDNPDNMMVTAIFHRFKSISRGVPEPGKFSFANIPLGEKVTIVALKTEGNKIYLATEETDVTKNEEIVLNYRKVTMKLLRKEMEKLY